MIPSRLILSDKCPICCSCAVLFRSNVSPCGDVALDDAFAFAATISQQRLPVGDVAVDGAIAFAAQRLLVGDVAVDGAFALAATISRQRLPVGDVALDGAFALAAQRPPYFAATSPARDVAVDDAIAFGAPSQRSVPPCRQ
jgi:hypothetical protein